MQERWSSQSPTLRWTRQRPTLHWPVCAVLPSPHAPPLAASAWPGPRRDQQPPPREAAAQNVEAAAQAVWCVERLTRPRCFLRGEHERENAQYAVHLLTIERLHLDESLALLPMTPPAVQHSLWWAGAERVWAQAQSGLSLCALSLQAPGRLGYSGAEAERRRQPPRPRAAPRPAVT